MARKGKPMSGALKAFLKKHGRFPKKGEIGRSRGRGTARRTHTKKARRHTSMARKRGRKRGRKSFKIPVLTVAILGTQAALAWNRHHNLTALDEFQGFYTGLHIGDGSFGADRLLVGWAPWLVKGLISKVARPMGAAPRVPFGLPISIS